MQSIIIIDLFNFIGNVQTTLSYAPEMRHTTNLYSCDHVCHILTSAHYLLPFMKQTSLKLLRKSSGLLFRVQTFTKEINFREVVTKNNLWSSGNSTSIVYSPYLGFSSGVTSINRYILCCTIITVILLQVRKDNGRKEWSILQMTLHGLMKKPPIAMYYTCSLTIISYLY